MTALTLALIVSLGFIALYYYKSLFDQINDQIKKVEQKSVNRKFICLKDQMILINLLKTHDLRAQQINQINEFVGQTLLLLFIFLALVQTIPLHLYL